MESKNVFEFALWCEVRGCLVTRLPLGSVKRLQEFSMAHFFCFYFSAKFGIEIKLRLLKVRSTLWLRPLFTNANASWSVHWKVTKTSGLVTAENRRGVTKLQSKPRRKQKEMKKAQTLPGKYFVFFPRFSSLQGQGWQSFWMCDNPVQRPNPVYFSILRCTDNFNIDILCNSSSKRATF